MLVQLFSKEGPSRNSSVGQEEMMAVAIISLLKKILTHSLKPGSDNSILIEQSTGYVLWEQLKNNYVKDDHPVVCTRLCG